MSETQLASMFIGSADDGNGIDRGRPSDAGNMIHIVNPQTSEILDYITLDNIIDDNHKKSLESYLETYDAIVLGGNKFSYDKHLEKRNHIIIPDEDGTYQEFILFEVDKYRDTEGRKTHFYAHATYLELKKAKVIYPTRREGLTLSQHAGWALNDTGWAVGIIEAEGTRTFNIENHTNPYEFIKRLANEFEVEIRFRVEHDGRRITARYVDFLERIGDWKGREVEFGKDLDNIRRIEKQDVVTALLGLGPEKEDGTRIEVLVEDEEALKRWGRVDEHGNLHHLIEPYEIQSERQEMTEEEARQYTRTALDKRINTQVTYETTILDLEEVPGLEHEKIRFGDTIRIKDTYFNPPLYLEARVYEIERSIKNKAKKDIKLGDYVEYTEEEVNAIWNQLRNEIRKKVSMAQVREYAEPKIIESPTPPPIEQGENAKWIDTSGEIKVPHVVIGDEWVKMSPTEAQEVGTYDASTIDDKASDASLLDKGIIDVGQVPLRTSVSGARIEWDGVNGLVQYDADNNVVTHLRLDGGATFAGDLEGATGLFSGEVVGGSIKSNTTIDVTTDLKVGDNIYVGDLDDGHIDKKIIFNEISTIKARDNSMELKSRSFFIDAGDTLKISLGEYEYPYQNTYIELAEGSIYISSDFGTNFNGDVFIDSFETPLWTGAIYLTDAQTVTPSKPLSQCMTGWILRWQAYNPGEGIEQSNFQYAHIPKVTLQAGGRGHRLVLRRGGTMVTKYFYIYDDYLTGAEGSGQGDNRNIVLSGVFEY